MDLGFGLGGFRAGVVQSRSLGSGVVYVRCTSWSRLSVSLSVLTSLFRLLFGSFTPSSFLSSLLDS